MSIEERMAAVEGRLAALESRANGNGGGAHASSGAAASGGPIEPLADHFLDQPWASKSIAKNPPKWNGESFVGKTYAEASPEWHDSMAGFMAWKEARERAETTPKLQEMGKNAGKPWFEKTAFEKKLHAAWAIRLRAHRGGPAPAAVPRAPAAQAGPSAHEADAFEGDLPF